MKVPRFRSSAIRQAVLLPRPVKQVLTALADVAVFLGCAYLILAMHAGALVLPGISSPYFGNLVLGQLILIILFASSGLYSQVLRYAGEEMLYRSAGAVAAAVICSGLIAEYLFAESLPSTIAGFLWATVTICTTGARMIAKSVIHSALRTKGEGPERVAIYGAGQGGMQLFYGMHDSPGFRVVAFLDDDPKWQGRTIQGRSIFSPDQIDRLVGRLRIDTLILAMPSLTRRRRKQILESLSGVSVRIKVVPGVDQLLDGKVTVSQLRDVRVDDLLWREKRAPVEALLHARVKGKSIMVTGAGGSIGSELCRQAVRAGVARLALLDNSEFALYSIEQELSTWIAQDDLDTELVTILCNCADQRAVENQLRRCETQTLYHAAAYKHVPLVENNIFSGMQNNLFGTLNCARAASAAGVEKFVLISTDKAVRPTNIMGASKRLAEMVLQAMDAEREAGRLRSSRAEETKFTMVRFGNVLDSAGSVVPLFRKQIQEGGPITLTHKEVTRYFMTIPEAAQLVLQASAMARGGEVFVLEMGEPVKIFDLATRMIVHSGLTIADEENPDGDIEIQVTGLRPGEKLYEELFIDDNFSGTDHPAIMKAEEKFLAWHELTPFLEKMKEAISAGDEAELRIIVERLVAGYKPPMEKFVERRKEARLSLVVPARE
ncbi:MAG: polysaccharide biosynthesis protein [Proteobacteria bacterium]|nr:polysaccharide biosynthesis protein [Pseudomonadota bacterium]